MFTEVWNIVKASPLGYLAIAIILVVLGTSVALRWIPSNSLRNAGIQASQTNIVDLGALNNTAVSPASSNGLILSLAINATTLPSGSGINITVKESNALSSNNTVSVKQAWALPALTQWGCSPQFHPPIGIAVFKGLYTKANVSSATALQIVPPGNWACPALWGTTNSLTFYSNSDMLAPIQTGESSIPLVMSVPLLGGYNENTDQYVKSGYNPNSTAVAPPTIIPFSAGIYTVAGGDEWGTLELLYFVVS